MESTRHDTVAALGFYTVAALLALAMTSMTLTIIAPEVLSKILHPIIR